MRIRPPLLFYRTSGTLKLHVECEPQDVVIVCSLVLVLVDVLEKNREVLSTSDAHACIIPRPCKFRHIIRFHRHKRAERGLGDLISYLGLGPEEEPPAVVRLFPCYLEPLSQRQVEAMDLMGKDHLRLHPDIESRRHPGEIGLSGSLHPWKDFIFYNRSDIILLRIGHILVGSMLCPDSKSPFFAYISLHGYGIPEAQVVFLCKQC